MKILKGKLSSILALSIFMTTAVPQGLQANSSVEYKTEINDSSKEIGSIFKKFQYETTVNWDQKDPQFLVDAQKELENSLADLKMSGVTEEQIQSYMLNNMLNENAKRDYQKLIETMKKQGLSSEEASEQMMNFMKKNYTEGVSFSGGASPSYRRIAIIIGVIVVGVVTCIIIKKHNKDEPQNEETTTTGETNGHYNGHYNGKTSGHYNGNYDGKTSGQYNGYYNGKTSGYNGEVPTAL